MRLMDLYNRGGSCRGYYHMQNGPEMISPDRPNHAGIPAACVERQKGRSLLLKALAAVQKGDVLEISAKENVTLGQDRKSTRLNSSHVSISYAVFCLKKKKP